MKSPILALIALIIHASTSSASTTTCHPRAWVRAPDLAPGLVTAAHARLSLNGTGCEVAQWEVGLRMKERAIFKFHVANVTLPRRPVYDYMPEEDEEDVRHPGDIFSSFELERGPRSKRWETYREQVKAYEETLMARDLWTSRAAERHVFDSRISLPLSGSGEEHVKGTNKILVREFRVNVPSTNFPYTPAQGIHFSSGETMQDISNVEDMFEYYFLITFTDGTVVDVPAGKTAFVPASERTLDGGVEEVEVVRKVQLADAWRKGYGPDCDKDSEGRDRLSDFQVEVVLPANETLTAGTTHILNMTIHQSGNSSQFPTRISAHVTTCTTDSWASAYAFDEAHERVATSCVRDGAEEDGPRMWRNEMADRVLMTLPTETYGEDSRDPRSVMREMMFDAGPAPRMVGQPTKLKGLVGSQSVLVNLTIPADIAYTYNRTLQRSENTLVISIDTEYGCQAQDPMDPARELTDDELWSPWWRESSACARAKASKRWSAGYKIAVMPPAERTWTHTTPLVDYKDPSAKAIVLSANDAPPVEEQGFPLVDTEVHESEDDLQRTKYGLWSRLPVCKAKARGHCDPGIGDGLVGEAWARYQWRREKNKAAESQGSQVVLQ